MNELNRKQFVNFLIIISIITFFGLIPVGAEELPPFQQPPFLLKASKMLPKDLLVGPNYRIQETIKNDGFVNTYNLDTDYGPLTLESTSLLMERVAELKALHHMEELEQTDAFADALAKGVMAPLNTAKGLVTHPIDTVKGVGSGIGNWFGDIGDAITSDDPNQENVISAAIGYAGTKRKYAYEYGINPYTRYEPVQKKLGKIAKASVVGGLTPKVAFGLIKKPVGTALGVSGTADTMKKLVRDKSPAEIDEINEKKLKAMIVSIDVIENFLKNPHYDPQEITLLVGALESMKNVESRRNFIKFAAVAPSFDVARYMRQRAQLMAHYHANVSPAARIVSVQGVPLLQRKDGIIVATFPLDHVFWTEKLWLKETRGSKKMEQLPGYTGKEAWITGTLDPAAIKGLSIQGWKAKDNFAK
ncbi:MAG: hypothetical protein JSV38_11200 [Desulfobacterales bacterium]|nr:MAG: hypothetical protein JSV38_11200 [Desulfobacterales bacterium]